MNRHDSNHPSADGFLASAAPGGEMAERTRTFDWTQTPVGPMEGWPQSLKIAVRIMLDSRYAMWLGWGPDLTFFYNDAYAQMTLGPKHPWALGKSVREVWAEIWGDVGPRAEKVLATGDATWDEGLLLFLQRQGFPEETYHTFSYSPIPGDQGGVGGMLCVVTEDTERTIGERRLRTLRELAARTTEEARSAEDACQTAALTLAENPFDLPFVLIYLLDESGRTARLTGATGLPEGSAAAPECVLLEQQSGWPFQAVLNSGQAKIVTALGAQFGPLQSGPWPEPTRQAVVLPMAKPGQPRPAGFVVAGVSPRLVLSDEYQGFLELLAGHVATAVANARAYEEERRRAESLAVIDRAKTAFFSNVSHEFRTPLTLMLGPVEELLARSHTDLPPAAAGQLEMVNRNGLRLLRLVNSLLDFSRIEAGRVRATYQATDLPAFTADLASNFRSACERAGLRLFVDCPPLNEPVFVDCEMWEKIVLNLISNAFKFTFEGQIDVSLRRIEESVELRVRDTGTGIPAEEMPRLFERFHRIENARGRTHEGSGIGLALVQELVKLHGGTVTAHSVHGRGTTFVVTVPLGTSHLPAGQIQDSGETFISTGAIPYVEEAMRWLPDDETGTGRTGREWVIPHGILPVAQHAPGGHEPDLRPRVLVADDNADMRQYIARVLSEQFQVEAVPDGEAALAAAIARPPELVLTDVMMPKLNGFGLLKQLRADPRTNELPIIMLSARAGEESRVEGMQAGADDYLVKPFSARELLARVSAHLQMARLRRDASLAIRRSEERFRAFVQASSDIIFRMNADWTEMRFLQGREFVEHTSEPNRSWLEKYIHPDDQPFVLQTIQEAIRTKQLFELEHRVVRMDGGLAWTFSRAVPLLDDAGEIVEWFGAASDVTARKEAEEKLRESEERLRVTLASIGDAVITTDTEARITFLNGVAETLTRWTNAEAVGQPLETVFHIVNEVTRLPAENPAARALREGIVVGLANHTVLIRKDGTEGPIDDSAAPVRDSNGEVVGCVMVFRDVSDRRRVEMERQHAAEAVQRLAASLSEADRLKDEFLATLAHELRNPLAPIRNGLELIRLSGNQNALVDQARAMMERQMTHMVRLVDDLMDLSRITRGKIELRRQQLDLTSAVNSAIEVSRPLIEDLGHELIVIMPQEAIVMDADPTRLAQVFMNLLTNAAKYSERQSRITLSAVQHDHSVVISVRDHGIGIPPDKLESIFEMFSQVDHSLEKSQGGLGIGLTLVKRLVEMHGGRVVAKSEGIGHGAEFLIRLPLTRDAASREEPSEVSVYPAAPLRILIVDDNRDAANSLSLMLRFLGNETETAYDGQEGIAKATQMSPDVVLLDIGMPKLNGYEAARQLRAHFGHQKPVLIAVTGWGQEEDRRRSNESGFDHHLVKPIDPHALLKLLNKPLKG